MANLNIIICCFLMCWMAGGLLAIPILDNDIIPHTGKCQSCPEKRPECEPDQVLVEVVRGTGKPGSCCSRYKCVSEMPVCDRSIPPIRYYPNACIECHTCSICLSICLMNESEQLLNCLTYNEEPKMKGDIWMENDGCTTCECDQQSERSCKAIQCLEPDCENPIKREGDCCPVCPSKEEEEVIRPSMGGTTSGPLLLLNASTTEKIEDHTMQMIDPSTPIPDEANDSSTPTTTATSSVSSTENEPSVVPLGSGTTIYSPSSSTESGSATASEGPLVPLEFDDYSTSDATSTKPSTDLSASSAPLDEDGPTDIYETSTDASPIEIDQITQRHESVSYSIEFNAETTPGQMLAEMSTEETSSTEDALPKASDYPSTSESPPPPPVSTSLVFDSNSNDSRPIRTVYNDDDDNVVSLEKDGVGRWIWIIGSAVVAGILLVFAMLYIVKKQRNSKVQNPAYHVVSQSNPQPIVNTGLYPLLPAIGSEPIKEELKH
ncbi:spore coat protein SP96 [Drosophila obscura]|uniref:spore coat protein SP96 n=1 Tax=Drosophila obscura TaxID=7282 RepID=UPI001BB23BD2|nr:spore coat protein SP96 [Drosophila obscura]